MEPDGSRKAEFLLAVIPSLQKISVHPFISVTCPGVPWIR